MHLNMAISNDADFAEVWRRGLGGLGTLDPEERWRWNHYAYAIFDLQETIYTQWRRQMLSDGDWAKYQAALANYLSSSGMREYWSETKDSFHPEFQRLVEGLEPKPLGLTTFPSN